MGIGQSGTGPPTGLESRRTVFPPPAPPVLGDEPILAPWPQPANYPSDLAAFVGDTFYLPYYALQLGTPQSRRLQRIAAYQARRGELLADLRSQLDGFRDLAGPARSTALTELAARQAAALKALEQEEEAVRADLTASGLFRSTVDGATVTLARPGPEPGTAQPLPPEVQKLLHAAQFHEGFSTPQRQLLLEMAFELTTPAPDGSQPVVFFWPATSRLRLTAQFPAALTPALDDLQRRKNELKAELRATVTDESYIFVGTRTGWYQRLAETQAPRFAEIDALAERIRTELAAAGYLAEPPPTRLPDDLSRRVGETVARKAALQRELNLRLKAFRDELTSDRVELRRQGNGLAIVVVPVKNGTVRPPANRAAVLAGLQALNNDFAHRFNVVAAELAALRDEIDRHNDTLRRPDAVTVESLAADFKRSFAAQEMGLRFRDYRRAVLEPGLSAAQRRLLLKGALAEFERARRAAE